MSSWLEATSLYKVDDKQFLNKSLEKILVAIPERKTHSSQNNSYSLRYFLSKQIVTQGNIVMELSFLLETLYVTLIICPAILEEN